MHILNTLTLENLLNWMRPTDRLELLHALLLELPKDFHQLQLEIVQGDLQAIKKIAHRIKGAYGNLGCDALCYTMQGLETMPEAIQGDVRLQTSIADEFLQTQDALRTYLAAQTGPNK